MSEIVTFIGYAIIFIGLVMTFFGVFLALKSSIVNMKAIKQMENGDPTPTYETITLLVIAALKHEKETGSSASKMLLLYMQAAIEKNKTYNPTTHFRETLHWTMAAEKLHAISTTLSMVEDINGDFKIEDLFGRYKSGKIPL